MVHPASPAADETLETANPVLVLQSRGGLLESFSRGAFAIADVRGVVAAAGDIERPVYPRSSIKIVQAIPLVESGAAQAFHVTETELALACASHSGEPAHVEAVRAWLSRIGAKEKDLVCGAHPPLGAEAASALAKSGAAPTRLHNNCSGKHTGFLALAKHLGAPFADYDHLDHPVQVRVIEALSSLSGVAQTDFVAGIDGCGAPNFALPLRALAAAFARIADPSELPETQRNAIAALLAAARAKPFFTAGTGRLCTRIMTETPDVYVKTGAEGVYAAALPKLGLGLALKIDDGGKAAAQALLTGLLVGLGALDPDSEIVSETAFTGVANAAGEIVGAREVAADVLIEVLADFSPQSIAAASAARPMVNFPKGAGR